MFVATIGMDYHSTPSHIREQFTLMWSRSDLVLHELEAFPESAEDDQLEEYVIISTCNRFEVYAAFQNVSNSRAMIEHFLARTLACSIEQVRPHFHYLEGRAAIEHLFRVAAGLESMVLGEPQILGQVSDAHTKAMATHISGPILSHLFSQAIHVGKLAHTHTDIGSHTTSIAHVAVLLAKEQIGSLENTHVLVVGAGKMAVLAARAARIHGVQSIACINRTQSKALSIADQFQGKTFAWEQMQHALAWADVIITATGAAQPIFDASNVISVSSQRRSRPLWFIDISLPSNVALSVRSLEHVQCFDVDHLQSVVDANTAQRHAMVPKIEATICKEVDQFLGWLRTREVVPIITRFRGKANCIVAREVERAVTQLTHPDEHNKRVLNILAHRIVNKLLHEPTVHLKASAYNGNGFVHAQVLSYLFALDEAALPETT